MRKLQNRNSLVMTGNHSDENFCAETTTELFYFTYARLHQMPLSLPYRQHYVVHFFLQFIEEEIVNQYNLT